MGVTCLRFPDRDNPGRGGVPHNALKFDLRKLFAGNGGTDSGGFEDAADTDYLPVNGHGEGLETDYQGLIASHFRRFGVSNHCITIEVRKIGQAPDGFDVFVGLVRLIRWERDSALRVMLGMPVLEAKIRKSVRATWLADYSHFGGLWLHASERMKVPPELRELLGALAPLPGSKLGPPGFDATSDPNASEPASGT